MKELLKYYWSNYKLLHAFSVVVICIAVIIQKQYNADVSFWYWWVGVVNLVCLVFGIISYKK